MKPNEVGSFCDGDVDGLKCLVGICMNCSKTKKFFSQPKQQCSKQLKKKKNLKVKKVKLDASASKPGKAVLTGNN